MKILALSLLLTISPILSKFLSYREATNSVGHTSIKNTPDERQVAALRKFGFEFFDKVRVRVGSPLYPSSCYRNPALNKAVGGVRNSDHQILEDVVACDIDQDGRGKVINRALFFIIKDEFLFYKLIWEGDNPPVREGMSSKAFPNCRWVHVSWSTNPEKNKLKRVYRAVQRGNKMIYLNFSTSGLN